MPLTRLEVRNEYGLGDPELYRGAAARKEDPKAQLEGLAVAGLVGLLRQLGDLAELAADVFNDLHEQVAFTSARARKMITRIKRMEATLPSLESSVQNQRSHLHFAYVEGVDWHAKLRSDQSCLLNNGLPQFMMDSYEECRDPPRLYLLDKFDSAGAGACFKRYSDATYFKQASVRSEARKAAKVVREKRANGNKRCGLQLRPGIHLGPSLSQRYKSRTQSGSSQVSLGLSPGRRTPRSASATSDGQSSSTEGASISIRSRPEIPIRSKSFDLRSGFGFSENFIDKTPSFISDKLEVDDFMFSRSQVNHEGPEGSGSDDVSQHDSLQAGSVNRSPSITWDEKIEIEKPCSPTWCDDIVVDRVEDSVTSTGKPQNDGNTTLQAIEVISLHDLNVPEGSMSIGNHFDEANSETDNYMDALNIMESEAETDSDCQTRREWKSLSCIGINSLNGKTVSSGDSDFSDAGPPSASLYFVDKDLGLSFVSDKVGEMVDNTSDHSDVQHPIASNFSNLGHVPPEFFSYGPTNNRQPVQMPTSETVSGDMASYGCSEMNGSQIDSVDYSPELKMPNYSESLGIPRSHDMLLNRNTADLTKCCSSPPHDASHSPTVRIWSNGSILGVEPSKPPDFGFPCPEVTGFDLSTLEVTNNNVCYGESSAISEATVTTCGSISRSSFFMGTGDVHNGQSNMADKVAIAPGDDLLVGCTTESQSSESSQVTACISSGISGLARRILENDLPAKASANAEANADISIPHGSLNFDTRKMQTPSQNNNDKVPCRQNSEGKMQWDVLRKPLSSDSKRFGQSSPPLEHMKISFYPTYGSEITALKLDISNSSSCASGEGLVFPLFQLLPGAGVPLRCTGSDSDDDSFCGSCPDSSEDIFSPHSDSNSDLWEQDHRSTEQSHEMYFESPINSSTAFNPLDSDIFSLRLGDANGLSVQSDGIDFPALDLIEHQIGQTKGMPGLHCKLPPPPPPSLPPLHGRTMTVQQLDQAGIMAASIGWAQEHSDKQLKTAYKLDGYGEADHTAHMQTLGGREDLLQQIRNKTFNLRQTATSKLNPTTQTSKNANVAALIEKASTIRQACAGSDEGGDDNWSDS